MRMREHSVSCVNYPVQKDIHAVTPAGTAPCGAWNSIGLHISFYALDILNS